MLQRFKQNQKRIALNSFETERYAGRPETIAAMRKALEKTGVEFTKGGVRLRG
jgi:hypothetical protein